MTSDERDQEMEWLKEQHEDKRLSYRDIGTLVDTHHEIVRQAFINDTLGNTLRGQIRDYMRAHPEEGALETRQQPPGSQGGTETSGAHGASNPAGTDGDVGDEDDGAQDSQSSDGGPRMTLEELLAERERAAQSSLLDEIVGCETVQQAAAVIARIRVRQIQAAYDKRQTQAFVGHMPVPITPYYLYPRPATLDELKVYTIALLLETPVLKELPLDVSANAARAVLNGEASLLNPPAGVHGDALVLLLTRAEAHYEDAGAREVAFAHAGKLFACGLRGEEVRDGVQIGDRMRRYACDDHWDRPIMIGTQLSDVISEKALPGEDWRYGSTGWVDKDGIWRPSRAELIARYRHVSQMRVDCGAQAPSNSWHHALNEEMTGLEVELLSPEYGMTFARDILGEARWPTSTRLGHHTQVRLSQMEADSLDMERLRSRRRLRTLLLWLPRLPLQALRKLVFVLRKDLAVYVEKQDRPKGKERMLQLLSPFLMRPLYDKEHPPVRPPRIRERIMPALYEPLGEQRWPTRVVSWVLYRRHSNLDGSVCGLSDWTVTDPPMTPDYMTPNPVSGHVPSMTYRLRFRAHEFEPGYLYPESETTTRRWYEKAVDAARRLVGGRPAA